MKQSGWLIGTGWTLPLVAVSCVEILSANWNMKRKKMRTTKDFNWISIVLQDAEDGARMDDELTAEMKAALDAVRRFIDGAE